MGVSHRTDDDAETKEIFHTAKYFLSARTAKPLSSLHLNQMRFFTWPNA